MNGKGSRPRNNASKAFRDNWDHVFGDKPVPIETQIEREMTKAGFIRNEKGQWYSNPNGDKKPRKNQ